MHNTQRNHTTPAGRRRLCRYILALLVASIMLAVLLAFMNRTARVVDSKVTVAGPPTVAPVPASPTPTSATTALAETTSAVIPGLDGQVLDRGLNELADKVNPEQDIWPVEVFNESTSLQLHQIAAAISSEDVQLDQIIADDFACVELRPTSVRSVFADGIVTVLRPTNRTAEDPLRYHGRDGLRQALRTLLVPFSDATNIKAKLKPYRVDLDTRPATTHVAVFISGNVGGSVVQQHADWRCEWNDATTDTPRLSSIRVLNYEEVVPRSTVGTLFQDRTATVFRRSDAFREQLIHGSEHWSQRLEGSLDPDVTGHQGVAVADFNGDGLDDVYICQPGGLPNRLVFQENDGTVRDATTLAGVDLLELTASALGIDLDEDGDQDLVVGTVLQIFFFENDGQGRFRRRSQWPTQSTVQSMAAADFDLDGDLDLYVCGYSAGVSIWETDSAAGPPVPYYDANNGGANVCLRNDGDFAFTDVTQRIGMDENNRRFSFAASWEDYDNDGDQDLYVANDFGRNNLYRNENGRFRDIAAEAGVEDMATGMSVSWADYNHDGWMDVYVGNMFSSAGNRIAYQRQFLPKAGEQIQDIGRRLARGNSLFQNRPAGKFVDVSESAAVTRGKWAWASKFVDVNNDGWEDLVVANGFITNQSSDDL